MWKMGIQKACVLAQVLLLFSSVTYCSSSKSSKRASSQKQKTTKVRDNQPPVQCFDGDGQAVDWWIMYKQSGSQEYVYLSSRDAGKPYSRGLHPYITIHDKSSPLMQTILNNLPSKSNPQDNRLIMAWNDQQPSIPRSDLSEKAKAENNQRVQTKTASSAKEKVADLIDKIQQTEGNAGGKSTKGSTTRDMYESWVDYKRVAHSKGIMGMSVIDGNSKETGHVSFYYLTHSIPKFPNGKWMPNEPIKRQMPFPDERMFSYNVLKPESSPAQHAMCISMTQPVVIENDQIVFDRRNFERSVDAAVSDSPTVYKDAQFFQILNGLDIIGPSMTLANFDPRNQSHRIYHQLFNSYSKSSTVYSKSSKLSYFKKLRDAGRPMKQAFALWPRCQAPSPASFASSKQHVWECESPRHMDQSRMTRCPQWSRLNANQSGCYSSFRVVSTSINKQERIRGSGSVKRAAGTQHPVGYTMADGSVPKGTVFHFDFKGPSATVDTDDMIRRFLVPRRDALKAQSLQSHSPFNEHGTRIPIKFVTYWVVVQSWFDHASYGPHKYVMESAVNFRATAWFHNNQAVTLPVDERTPWTELEESSAASIKKEKSAKVRWTLETTQSLYQSHFMKLKETSKETCAAAAAADCSSSQPAFDMQVPPLPLFLSQHDASTSCPTTQETKCSSQESKSSYQEFDYAFQKSNISLGESVESSHEFYFPSEKSNECQDLDIDGDELQGSQSTSNASKETIKVFPQLSLSLDHSKWFASYYLSKAGRFVTVAGFMDLNRNPKLTRVRNEQFGRGGGIYVTRDPDILPFFYNLNPLIEGTTHFEEVDLGSALTDEALDEIPLSEVAESGKPELPIVKVELGSTREQGRGTRELLIQVPFEVAVHDSPTASKLGASRLRRLRQNLCAMQQSAGSIGDAVVPGSDVKSPPPKRARNGNLQTQQQLEMKPLVNSTAKKLLFTADGDGVDGDTDGESEKISREFTGLSLEEYIERRVDQQRLAKNMLEDPRFYKMSAEDSSTKDDAATRAAELIAGLTMRSISPITTDSSLQLKSNSIPTDADRAALPKPTLRLLTDEASPIRMVPKRLDYSEFGASKRGRETSATLFKNPKVEMTPRKDQMDESGAFKVDDDDMENDDPNVCWWLASPKGTFFKGRKNSMVCSHCRGSGRVDPSSSLSKDAAGLSKNAIAADEPLTPPATPTKLTRRDPLSVFKSPSAGLSTPQCLGLSLRGYLLGTDDGAGYFETPEGHKLKSIARLAGQQD